MSVIKEIGNNFLVTSGPSERLAIISVDNTSELRGASPFVRISECIDLVVRYIDLIEPIIKGKYSVFLRNVCFLEEISIYCPGQTLCALMSR